MKLTCNNITNDDDYRDYVKTKIVLFMLLILLGAAAVILALISDTLFGITLNDHQRGFYSGLGSGLIAGGLFLAIKFGLQLNNKEKLRKNRIKNTDERILIINSKALVVAGIILLVSIYVVGIVGGLFYPILFKIMLVPIAIFLLSYVIAYKVIAAKS